MRREPDRDLGTAAWLLLAAMTVPLVLVAVSRRILAQYVTGLHLTIVAAAGFAIVLWLVVDARGLDRVDVAVASILMPLLAFLAVILLATLGVIGPEIRRFLFWDITGLFRYVALFSAAGLAAVALSRRLREDERVPGPRRLAIGVIVVVLLGVTLAAGVNYASASSATVTAVEPGTQDHQPALNVTVEGPPAELRVAVAAPGGHTVRKRLSRGEMGGGGGTVSIPIRFHQTPPPDTLPISNGGYEVRVKSLLGASVASDRYAVDGDPTPTVTDVRASVGPVDWGTTPNATVRSRPLGETRIGVAVVNDTPFPADYTLGVRYSGPGRAPDVRTEVRPRDEVGLVVGLPPAVAEHVRAEQGGQATVVLSRDHEPVLVRRVSLPAR